MAVTTPNPGRLQQWKSQVMVGDLPPDFLRIAPSQTQQQIYYDAQTAHMLQAQQSGFGGFSPANIAGRLSITFAQAKLAKNYGITKMDTYCRIRLGHSILETPTASNGGKNPRWNKVVHCYLPIGVDSFHLEIYDEKFLSMDDRIAWSHITIPDNVLTGETVDDWYTLSGKQGEDKEGMINLVLSFTPSGQSNQGQSAVVGHPMMYAPSPVVMVPANQPYYPITGRANRYVGPPLRVPPVGGTPAYAIGQPMVQQPLQQPPQQQPQRPQGPAYTDEDVKQIKEMFPHMDDEAIKSLLECHRGNKEATINAILAM